MILARIQSTMGFLIAAVHGIEHRIDILGLSTSTTIMLELAKTTKENRIDIVIVFVSHRK